MHVWADGPVLCIGSVMIATVVCISRQSRIAPGALRAPSRRSELLGRGMDRVAPRAFIRSVHTVSGRPQTGDTALTTRLAAQSGVVQGAAALGRPWRETRRYGRSGRNNVMRRGEGRAARSRHLYARPRVLTDRRAPCGPPGGCWPKTPPPARRRPRRRATAGRSTPPAYRSWALRTAARSGGWWCGTHWLENIF